MELALALMELIVIGMPLDVSLRTLVLKKRLECLFLSSYFIVEA